MERYKEINLDRNSKEHLYIQLANAIEKMIVGGDLTEKDKLPPIRKLADALDVNTVTIVNAYKYLEQKGRVFKKLGSGTFIVPLDSEVTFDEEGPLPHTAGYDFSLTSPTGNLFPVQAFKKAINGVLDTEGGSAFSYQESRGFLELRQAITEYLNEYDIQTTAADIQIISGAQQGIDIVTKSILEYGDYILVESPTYAGAIATFRSKGLNIIEIPIRRNGINFESLESIAKRFKPKLFYTMPNFQNPTGYTYSDDEKKRLLELSKKYDFFILEDDYATELNFSTETIHSMKAIDDLDQVIYIKSFSKIFMPGLRLGFMISPKRIANKIILAKHTTDISTSGLIQRAFCWYLNTGDWKHQISKIRLIMGNRSKVALEALDKYMPEEVAYQVPKGGINIWLELPEALDASKLELLAKERGVLIVAGDAFYASKSTSNDFRVSVAAISKDRIDEGIRLLSECVQTLLDREADQSLEKLKTI
jgi:DNA-binding transcriptional MocR family regulator